MIKVVLSWIVVIYVMLLSATNATMLFEKIVWKGNPNFIETITTCIVTTIAVVVAILVSLYTTGLWTP